MKADSINPQEQACQAWPSEGRGRGGGSSYARQRQSGVSGRGGWIEVKMISGGVEISITGGVAGMKDEL